MNKNVFSALLILQLSLFIGCANQQRSSEDDVPDLTANMKLAEIYLQAGAEYIRRGRDEVALQKLEKALTIEPKNPEVHQLLAIVYERLKEDDKAEQHYQEALSLNTEDSATHNNYGAFLCRQGRSAEGEQHFLKAAQNPRYKNLESAYTNVGLCVMQEKKFAKAEDYFRKALEINPNFPIAFYQLGELNYEQGHYYEARNYLQRYIEIAPHTPQTLWLGIRIERKLGNKNAEDGYAYLLRSKFPDSPEFSYLHEPRPRR